DDLVRDKSRHKAPSKQKPRASHVPKGPAPAQGNDAAKPAAANPAGDGAPPARAAYGTDESKLEAIEHVLETIEGLFRERDGNLWGSMVKQTLKRKRPMFNENYHGYPSFNQLLEDAETRG